MPDPRALGLAVASTVVASAGMVCLKISSGGDRRSLRGGWFVGGCLLFVLGTVLVILAVKRERLSVIFPTTALTYIWVMVLSRVILRERLNMWKMLAVVLIVAGIALVVQR